MSAFIDDRDVAADATVYCGQSVVRAPAAPVQRGRERLRRHDLEADRDATRRHVDLPTSGLPARQRSRQPERREHAVVEAGHGADPVAGEGEDIHAGAVPDAGGGYVGRCRPCRRPDQDPVRTARGLPLDQVHSGLVRWARCCPTSMGAASARRVRVPGMSTLRVLHAASGRVCGSVAAGVSCPW